MSDHQKPEKMIEKVIFSLLALLITLNNVSTLTSQKWGTTTLELETLKYVWTIQNFNASRLSNQNFLISPEFWAAHQPEYKWRLQLHRDGDFLSIYLQSRTNARAKVRYTISMDTFTRSNLYVFGFDGTDGFSRAIHATKATKGYDDTVVVKCEVERLIGEKNSTRQCQGSISKKSAESELIDDFETLLDQEIFSDVTLVIDNNEIRAHKAILASRSSVFRKLLTSDLYNSSNIIPITDVEPRVFKEVLRYMYVGRVEHIEKLSQKLLMAANKYNVKGLKSMCEEYLCKDLKDGNAMEILDLANEQEADSLATEAASFIASHGASIIRTAEFKSMERKLHNPLFDVFRAYFER